MTAFTKYLEVDIPGNDIIADVMKDELGSFSIGQCAKYTSGSMNSQITKEHSSYRLIIESSHDIVVAPIIVSSHARQVLNAIRKVKILTLFSRQHQIQQDQGR